LVKWSQERSVSVNKGALVFDEYEELAVAQDGADGESVAEPVKVPVGEIKTIGGGGVIKFHIGGIGQERIVQELIDDNGARRVGGRAGVLHGDRGRIVGQEIAMEIIGGDVQDIGRLVDRDGNGPA